MKVGKKEIRYKNAIIVAIILFIVEKLFLIIFYLLIPRLFTKNCILNSLIYSAILVFFIFIGIFFFGYLLAPLYLFIYKKFLGKNKIFGIQDTQQPHKFNQTFQGLFPALLAINLSLLLISSETVLKFVLEERKFNPTSYVGTFNLYFAVLLFFNLFTMMVACALFSPAWFLSDAGVVYSTKEIEKQKGRPGECRTVGGWYITLLKGYTGVGVLISFILVFLGTYSMLLILVVMPLYGIIMVLIYYLLIPLFITGGAIIPVIILDVLKEHRIRYVRKWAEKFGITDKVDIKFTKIE